MLLVARKCKLAVLVLVEISYRIRHSVAIPAILTTVLRVLSVRLQRLSEHVALHECVVFGSCPSLLR